MPSFHENAKLLTGEAASPFSDPFPDAIAHIANVDVKNDRDLLKKSASISVDLYASLEAFDDVNKKPFETKRYYFTIGGHYAFEMVFGIPGTTLDNIFNYLQSLPEFAGWTVILPE